MPCRICNSDARQGADQDQTANLLACVKPTNAWPAAAGAEGLDTGFALMAPASHANYECLSPDFPSRDFGSEYLNGSIGTPGACLKGILVMNTYPCRPADGVGAVGSDYARLAGVGRGLQARAVRGAFAGIVGWLSAGLPNLTVGAVFSRRA